MKSFNEFIGEGVRDRMTPKSEEDQRRGFDKIGPQTVLNYGNSELIPWVVDYALERGANPNLRFRINNVEMTPLEHAALEGNMEVVEILLKHDNVIVTKNAIGNAIYKGHTAIVDLLEQCVRPGLNESVRDRMTPKSEQDILEQSKKWKPWEILEYGASNGLISLVKYAIDMGADVRQFDSYALRLAVTNDYKEIVKLLLKSGADVHTLDDCLIIIACEEGLVDMVKLLIKHGANIHARNNRPMKMAMKKGHDKIIRLLQKYDNTDRMYREIDSRLRTNIGVGLMRESVRDMMTPKSDEDVIKMKGDILKEIVGIVKSYKGGLSLYDYSEFPTTYPITIGYDKFEDKGNNIDTVHRIVTLYVDSVKISAYGVHNGRTLSEYYLNYDDLEPDILLKVRSMLRKITTTKESRLMRYNESVRDMMTPKSKEDIIISLKKSGKLKPTDKLEYGAKNGKLPYVREAIEKDGFDPDWNNGFAMRLACVHGHANIVKYLLEMGADRNMVYVNKHKEERSWTPIQFAESFNHRDIVNLLDTYFPNVELHRMNNKIKSFFRFNESVRDKMTPRPTEQIEGTLSNMSQMEKNMELINAIRGDDTFLANMLIDKGANPNTRYANNWSALMCAIQRGQTDVVQKLIDNGADIDHLGNGITPFTLAEAWDRKEIMEILKKQGARR